MKYSTDENKSPILDLSSLECFEPFEGFQARLFHTSTQTFSFWKIKKGAKLPHHQHINEQVSIVTKGVLALTINGKTTEMKPGMVAVIPSKTDHSGVAITDVEVTDVFYPIRTDFPK